MVPRTVVWFGPGNFAVVTVRGHKGLQPLGRVVFEHETRRCARRLQLSAVREQRFGAVPFRFAQWLVDWLHLTEDQLPGTEGNCTVVWCLFAHSSLPSAERTWRMRVSDISFNGAKLSLG